jgi:hypothetical protein
LRNLEFIPVSSTELSHYVVLGNRGSGEHFGSTRFGNLYSHMTYTARASEYQHFLNSAYIRPIKQSFPCSQKHQGKAATSRILRVVGFFASKSASTAASSASEPSCEMSQFENHPQPARASLIRAPSSTPYL